MSMRARQLRNERHVTGFVALHGRGLSLVLERRRTGAPLWRHWGARIDATGGVDRLADTRLPASFSLDDDVPLTTAPGFGLGWFDRPIVRAHRDGRDFACAFDDCTVEQGEYAITIRLRDAVARLSLVQHIALSPESDVVTLSAALTNDGDATLTVDWLASAMLPLPGDCTRIRSFTGRHNAEFAESIEPMPRATWVRENRRGVTGHAGPPGVFVLRGGAGWHDGDVFAVQLAWSGNHRLAIARSDEGFWTLEAGGLHAPGEVRLAPGESLEAPELLATFSRAGLNGASQNFHAAIRARSVWPGGAMTPRPVHLNSWEGCYFDHDETRLRALADRAAAIGVERFVLDDGWFKARRDDRAGLGDWTPDPGKYPHGLGGLAAHIVALGMEFGLWVEPEMVNPDSDLYRAHPDWVLHIDGRASPTARNQLVLDLGRADVRDHLFERIDALLRTLPIAYLKWDHNRDLTAAGGADGRAGYAAQVHGAYAAFDRIRLAHPDVEIEACAGGGGRIDAGIAGRTHRFWASDNLDAVSRIPIQRGFLAFMPPERMGSHVGASPAHATGRGQALGFRAAVALPGHFGVELGPATLDAVDSTTLAAWIARFKGLRDRLHSGRTWLGEGADGILWHAVGEPDDLTLLVIRVDPARDRRPQPLRLPMLAGRGLMQVRLESIDETRHGSRPSAPLFEAMAADGVSLRGDWLAEVGLPLPAMNAESVAIFRLKTA